MSRQRIPEELHRIASVKERKAAMDAARAARAVRESEEDLLALDASHAEAESQVLADPARLDGSALLLLGLGRETYVRSRRETTAELEARESALDDRRRTHLDRLHQKKGKEELAGRFRDLARDDARRAEQKEHDDVSSSRRTRADLPVATAAPETDPSEADGGGA